MKFDAIKHRFMLVRTHYQNSSLFCCDQLWPILVAPGRLVQASLLLRHVVLGLGFISCVDAAG